MSQAGQINSAAGPFPPIILESITTDKSETINTPPAGLGTVVPSANNIRFNADNGMVTSADPAQPNLLFLRFSRGTVTTTDATTTTIIPFTLFNNTSLTIQVIVVGRDTTSGDAVGGYCTATVKNVAGITSEIGPTDIIVRTDASLAGSTFTVNVSGAQFLVQVTGLVGKTIQWTACLPGVTQSPQ